MVIQLEVVMPKVTYMQATLNGVSKLHLYNYVYTYINDYVCMCVTISIKEK